MIETALVFDNEGRTIAWHEPAGRTSTCIPDSKSLWDLLWENRDRLGGVAHSHPWDGKAIPSLTDISTFAAIERGLGRNLCWPITTFTDTIYIVRNRFFEDRNPMGWCSLGTPYIKSVPHDLEELRNRSRGE